MRNNDTTSTPVLHPKIAIVGVACRFPGGIANLDDYWHVLSQGQDVVTEISAERFGTSFYQHPDRKTPGRSVTFAAGVLNGVEQFDAAFFGIAPREAEQMDPQQRLLLELTWEALENGGQRPTALAGSDCAVYVGIASNDYMQRRVGDPASMDAYTMTGNTASIAANRISYLFDFLGPSVAVDTACSSSLVALHHACQAIRHGESSMAIAAGVNMLLHPLAFVGFSQASMLSERGRCRTFDASGDGYVRSEGAAVLFLKPLEQAQADGDPIHAVIIASGINADGKTSSMTVPSDIQQANLLRKVYRSAGLAVDDLVYLEAHGTGTAVGDPIETRAIGEVLGKTRTKPLLIGSAKTNLGHLETASGMAGLLKAVLSLQHQLLPATLHVQQLNPHIDFAGLNLSVVTEPTPLPVSSARQLMGVNSFGFGGANAHVVIERYRPLAAKPVLKLAKLAADTAPLLLSARSPAALKAMAAQYADLLAQDETLSSAELAWNVQQQRQQLPYGLMLKAASREAWLVALQAFANDEKSSLVMEGELLSAPAAAPVVLVFSGNGSQWQGMGQVLFAQSSLFKEAFVAVNALFEPMAGYSLIDLLLAHEADSQLANTEVAQPLLFALQVGMTTVLRSHALTIAATVGHSVGEVAAAWAAGLLSLEQAVTVIYQRSHAQGKTRGQGRMAAVSLGLSAMREYLQAHQLHAVIEIAGMNSPHAVTLSGSLADLEQLEALLGADKVGFKLLDLDYAFHSHWMDAIQEELLTQLNDLKPSDSGSSIQFISSVEGCPLMAQQLDAHYWWRNIREPVDFAKAIHYSLHELGARIFIEVGPRAILRSYITESLRAQSWEGLVLATGKRKQEQVDCLEQAAWRACLAGARVDWAALLSSPARRIQLPNYPWQRERYWYPLTNEGYDLVNRLRVHPLLGYRLKDAVASWENQLDTGVIPWLADHVVDGAVVVPAAAYVEMALAAAYLHAGNTTEASVTSVTDLRSQTLEQLEIHAPIILPEQQAKTLRFTLSPHDGSFTITSRDRLSDHAWTLNVIGRLTGAALKVPTTITADQFAEWQQTDKVVQGATHYALTEAVGLSYLPAFQAVQTVWVQPDGLSALATLAMPTAILAKYDAYYLHPALLDASFQLLVDLFQQAINEGRRHALIPIQLGQLYYYGSAKPISQIFVKLQRRSPRSVLADFYLFDAEQQLVAELKQCRFRGVQFARVRQSQPAAYQFQAVPQPLHTSQLAAPVLDTIALREAAEVAWQALNEPWQREQHFAQIMPLLDALATAYAWQALSALANEQGQLNLAAVAAEQQLLARRLLSWLEDDQLAVKMLQPVDNTVHASASTALAVWQLVAEADLPAPQAIWLAILGDAPAYLPELVMLGRHGEHLVPLLTGALAPETLFNTAKSSIHEHWLDSSPSFRALNQALLAAIQAAVAQWPSHRRLRILELGGAYGALTQRILPLLPASRCDYVFTDTDELRLAQAVDTLSAWPWLKAQVLSADLGDESLNKLVAEESFDIIIASHALLEWHDLKRSVKRLRASMKPNGLLLLAQAQDSRALDLSAGLMADWWVSASDTVLFSRLHTAQEWQQALAGAGFAAVEVCSEPASLVPESEAFIVVAKAGADAKAKGLALNLTEAAANEPAATGVKSESEAADVSKPSSTWLIIANATGYSAQLAEQLQQHLVQAQQQVVCSTTLDLTSKPQHIVHLLGLEPASPTAGLSTESLMALQQQRCVSVVAWLQMLEQQQHPARLWLVTADALGLTPDSMANPPQAPLWGLGRVLMNEYPDLQTRLIDLVCTAEITQIAADLAAELRWNDGEDEVLLTTQGRYVLRLQPVNLTSAAPTQAQAVTDSSLVSTPPAVCLDFSSPGPLKHLYWRALAATELKPDEIEIRPAAAGLNFRDVMYAMGLLSDEAVENGFAGASLGMELAGTVQRVGAAVTEFKAGDAVMGFAPACFSSRVITQTTAITHKPIGWSDEEAATVPTTFFTVYYALKQLAQLQAGERLLIHGAAGGVGLAAIQFARYCGAEVFATAGTDEKRDFVRLMGVDHVMDSRSLHFAEDIMQLTQGQGVDVVLNSISGEAINRNLNILRPFGRFLELGKRDFYENSKVGLRPFRNNISYFGIDADQLLVERPDLARRLFREMMALFAEGVLRPLPHRVFPASRIQEAFRYMQQSRQIGKVVLSFAQEPLQASQQQASPARLDLRAKGEGSYLVTGGLSGFGLASARWLVEKGASCVILVSRRGKAAPEAEGAIAELSALGVRVEVFACDVTDRAALEALLTKIRADLPPLRGILHAAMVLDDGIMRNLDAQRFQAVLAPKILGAWHLHQLSQTDPLDFFALYSSVTTYLGNPGQANYVAANLFLESLAQARRASKLPATYIAWGPIADAGYLVDNAEVKAALQARLGGQALPVATALSQLETLLLSEQAGAALVDWEWSSIQKFMPMARSPKFDLMRSQAGKDEQGSTEDIQSQLAGLNYEEAQTLIADLLVAEVGHILRLPRERLALDKSVFDLGMDSLMGMELVVAIEERFGIRLPVMALTEGATIQRIAQKIADQLLNETGEVTQEPDLPQQTVADMARKHGTQLSEEQLVALSAQIAANASTEPTPLPQVGGAIKP